MNEHAFTSCERCRGQGFLRTAADTLFETAYARCKVCEGVGQKYLAPKEDKATIRGQK